MVQISGVRPGNPSVALRATAPFAQGSLCPAGDEGRRTGEADCRVGLRPPCNDSVFVIPRSEATWESVPLLAVWFVQACPGGHVGPPLRRGGGLREATELFVAAVWRRGGTEPAPYTMVEETWFSDGGPRGTRER